MNQAYCGDITVEYWREKMLHEIANKFEHLIQAFSLSIDHILLLNTFILFFPPTIFVYSQSQ